MQSVNEVFLFTPKPPPTCSLVALTHFSPALRAKAAYVGGGYQLHLRHYFFIFGSNMKEAIYPKTNAAQIPTALALNPP